MNLAEYCRACADDCESIADQVRFAPTKAQFLDLMNRWKKLAERSEHKDNSFTRLN
jgi:hypothetical protein